MTVRSAFWVSVALAPSLAGCAPGLSGEQFNGPAKFGGDASGMLALYSTQCQKGSQFSCKMAHELQGTPANGLGDQRQAAPTQLANSSVSQAGTAGPSERTKSDVALVRQGGTYVVPVRVNGALILPFILDSGASDVSIPADVFITLVRTGTISKSDLLGSRVYMTADGSRTPSPVFRIHTLRVGNREVHDVTGSVGKIAGLPLLGQTFLSKFRSWSIDNERGLLHLE